MRNAVLNAGFLPLRLTNANTVLFPGAALWRLLKKAGLATQGSDVRTETRGSNRLNRVLTSILKGEAAYLRGRNFSFGLSIFMLAAKPGGTAAP